jgi:hypothetical protein
MEATFADFSISPPLCGNAEARTAGGGFGGDHVSLGAGGSATLDFAVQRDETIIEATLKVTALTSKLGRSPGFAPMDIEVNGKVLVEALTIPGGGDLPGTMAFAVPGELLRPGTNTLTVRSSTEAATQLRLYRVTLDSVYERDRSERAMGARNAERAVFAFRTERRAAGTAEWTSAGQLRLYVERGEASLPAQISWRAVDGAEGAASFQSAMTDFLGHHRDADGTIAEFRGRLDGRWAFPEGTSDASPHHFRTEEGWGGGWHASGDLRVLVDHGGAAIERVTWRDQRTNGGSICLRSDGSAFTGFYQRINEGPIGYRGTAVRAEPKASEATEATGATEAPEGSEATDEQPTAGGGELYEELRQTARQLERVVESAVSTLSDWLRAR